jgi:hypothetical protein
VQLLRASFEVTFDNHLDLTASSVALVIRYADSGIGKASEFDSVSYPENKTEAEALIHTLACHAKLVAIYEDSVRRTQGENQ